MNTNAFTIFYECLLFFNFHLCASTTLGVCYLPGLIFVQKKFEKVRCISRNTRVYQFHGFLVTLLLSGNASKGYKVLRGYKGCDCKSGGKTTNSMRSPPTIYDRNLLCFTLSLKSKPLQYNSKLYLSWIAKRLLLLYSWPFISHEYICMGPVEIMINSTEIEKKISYRKNN